MSISVATTLDTRDLYTPLQRWQTRILRVHPASSPDTPVEADLLRAGLADGPYLALSMDEDLITFEAISYTWGSPHSEGYTVLCNGVNVEVGSNLVAALRRFRYIDVHRYVWADRLCINQMDTAEKNAQVAIMFNIFRKADRVLAWLGDAGPDTSVAMQHLAHFEDSSEEDLESVESVESIPRVWKDNTNVQAGLLDIFCRPWSRRVWVRQEIYAAKRVDVFVGGDRLSFESYYDHGMTLRDELEKKGQNNSEIDQIGLKRLLVSLKALRGLQQADDLTIVKLQRKKENCLDPEFFGAPGATTRPQRLSDHIRRFETVLQESRWLKASEGQDLIYALLNMTPCPLLTAEPTAEQLGIRVDYVKSYSRVLQDVTKFIMNRDRSLDVLISYDQPSARPNKASDCSILPSWTVDWTECAPRTRYGRDGYPDCRALRWQNPCDEGTLSLSAITLTVVPSLSMRWDPKRKKYALNAKGHTHLRVAHSLEGPAGFAWYAESKELSCQRFLTDQDDRHRHRWLPHSDFIAVLAEGTAFHDVLYLQPKEDGRFSFLHIGTSKEHISLFFGGEYPEDDCTLWNGYELFYELFETNKISQKEFVII
ncbi:hypothetical protein LTR17_003290 [Elasticomyces elasticus]|nr:hypothetical protein LTR17_003290 [Elasticomyces elasticus]